MLLFLEKHWRLAVKLKCNRKDFVSFFPFNSSRSASIVWLSCSFLKADCKLQLSVIFYRGPFSTAQSLLFSWSQVRSSLAFFKNIVSLQWNTKLKLKVLFPCLISSRRQPLNGYYLGALLFKICFTFWSRFFFYISHGFHDWLLFYFTRCFNWIDFNFFCFELSNFVN